MQSGVATHHKDRKRHSAKRVRSAQIDVLTLVLSLAPAIWAAEPPQAGTAAQEPPKITHDWPCFTGPEGTFADPSKVPLLDDFGRARLVWVSEHADLGWGKTVSGGGTARYPKTMAPSGSGSLIVAGGLVIAAYFSPKNSADADDIILALDAATGNTRWKQVFASKGANRGAGKGNVYGPTPAAADGKVYHLGTTGRVYAVDLATGKPVWESDLGEIHRQLEALKAKTPVNENRIDGLWREQTPVMCSPLMVIDGVLMVTVRHLQGFDAATGKKLWEIAGATSIQSVPCPAKLGGTMYAFCSGSDGYMRLIRPKTGEVVWKESLGACFLPTVADGRAFVPRVKAPAEGAPLPKRGKDERPVLTAFALSETGAKLLWQSDFPMDGDAWHAYRDGVVFACNSMKNPGNECKIKTFKAEDGTLLGQFDDVGGDRGRFHLWGDRIVVIGDNHHESLGSNCYYWALTPGVKDLKKSGKPYSPRVIPGHVGVCGYIVLMRDPFADGYQFTRAINKEKAVGVIMCWDLRARPQGAMLRFGVRDAFQGIAQAENHADFQAEVEGGRVSRVLGVIPLRSWTGQLGRAEVRGQPEAEAAVDSGRWAGDVALSVGADQETWRLELQGIGDAVSGSYERRIPALAKAQAVEGKAEAKVEVRSDGEKRWTLTLAQAVSPSPQEPVSSRKDAVLYLEQAADGRWEGWVRTPTFIPSPHEVQVVEFKPSGKQLNCRAFVLLHSDPWLRPSAERSGTVALEVDAMLEQTGENWLGTYKGRYGVAWSCRGEVGPASGGMDPEVTTPDQPTGHGGHVLRR
jgi:hypothetical protein